MEQQLSERFFNTIGEMRRYLMQAKPFEGISHNEVTILHLIEVCQKRGERASTTWLSERLKLAKPSISQALNAMEEKGWIHRSIDPDNRRQTNIEVTEEGQRKMAQTYRMVVASITRVLDHMGRENAERFVELMEQFLDGAKVEFQRKE